MHRILYLSGYQIFPPFTGGHIRAANIIRGLARSGCEVRVYSLGGRRPDYKNRISSSVSTVDSNISEYVYRGLLRGVVQGVFQRLQIVHFWQTIVGFTIHRDPLLRHWLNWSDTVIINHSYAYTFLRRAKNKNRIINSHNLEHHVWIDSWWKKHLLSPLIRKIETRAARSADAVWCCAPDEELFYREAHPTLKTYPVPNGVFPESYQKNSRLRTTIREQLGIMDWQRVILFVGSDYGPNRKAYQFLRDFAGQNSEFLKAHGLLFLVAGSVVRLPTRDALMITTGFVESVTPYFHAADMAINPVVDGSGTNVKIFEYLASHLPLISTFFGVRGLDLKNHDDFFGFDLPTLKDALECGPLQKTAAQLEAMAQKAFDKNRATLDIQAICERLTHLPYHAV